MSLISSSGGHLDVEDQAFVRARRSMTAGLLQFAEGTADVVHQVAVAIDLPRLALEGRHIPHGGNLRLPVEGLAAVELLQAQAHSSSGIAQLADEAQHRPQVVDLDVVADEDPVLAQQVAQKGDLHGLALDEIEDVLIQVAGTDAVIPE
jgi:hypothetical protein